MSFRLDTYNPYGKPDNKKNDPFGPLLTCKSMMAKCWHLFVNINWLSEFLRFIQS